MAGEPFAEPVRDTRSTQLHLCPEDSCGSKLVQLLRSEVIFDTAGRPQAHTACWCPNCQWRGEGVHEPAIVDELMMRQDEAALELREAATKYPQATIRNLIGNLALTEKSDR